MTSSATPFDVDACWQRFSTILGRHRETRLNRNAIERAVRDVERVLDEHVIAEPNSRALAALYRAAKRIPTYHREARETAFEIYDRATLFYSEDNKYLLHGGAASLYEEMRLTLLERLRIAATPR